MAEAKLTQLKQAEALVLADPSHYPTILPAVLALAAQPDIPLRHWIANFLVNTFSSRTLDPQVKEGLSSGVVDALRILVDETDTGVLKSCVQCSSLIYPLLFRRMYSHYEVTECVDVERQRGIYGDGLDSSRDGY
jgi:symplekin